MNIFIDISTYLILGVVFMILVEIFMAYKWDKYIPIPPRINNIDRIIGVLIWPTLLIIYIWYSIHKKRE